MNGYSKYKKIRPQQGKILSQVIPGFWVRPSWFWQDPLPDEDEILDELLQS